MIDAARSGDPAQLEPLIGVPRRRSLSPRAISDTAKQVLANFVKAYGQKTFDLVEAQGFEYLASGARETGRSRFRSSATARCGISTLIVAMKKSFIVELAGTNLVQSPCVKGYVQSQMEYASKGHDGNSKWYLRLKIPQ